MAGSIYDLVVNVSTNIAQLTEGMARVSSTVEQSAAKMATSFDAFGSKISAVGKGLAGLAAIGGISDVILKDVEAFAELEGEIDKIEAQLTATGNVADTSVSKILDVADALSKTTTYSVQSTTQAASALLRFTNITGENFERTLKDSADLAAVMGTDIPEAAERLGKALESSAGATQLRRIGLLSDAQLAYLKALEAVGLEQERQAAILDIIEEKSKGVAAAIGAEGLASAWKEFTNAMAEAGVETGKNIALSTDLESHTRSLTTAIRQYNDNAKLAATVTGDERTAMLGLMTAAAEGDPSAVLELAKAADEVRVRADAAAASLRDAVAAANEAAGSDAHFKALAVAIKTANDAAQKNATDELTFVKSAITAYDSQANKVTSVGQAQAKLNALVLAGGAPFQALSAAADAAHVKFDAFIKGAAQALGASSSKEAFNAQLKSINDIARAQEAAGANQLRLDASITSEEIKDAQFEAAARIATEQDTITKIGALRQKQADDELAAARKQVDILQQQQASLQAAVGNAPNQQAKIAATEQLAAVQDKLDKAITDEAIATQKAGDVSKETRQAQILATQRVADQINKANESYNKFLQSLDDEATKRQFEITLIDKTAVEQAQLTAEFDESAKIHAEALDLEAKYVDAVRTGQTELAETYRQQLANLDSIANAEITAAGNAARYKQAATEAFTSQLQVVQDVTTRLSSFIVDFVQHGSSAFKSLWQDFVSWALQAIAKVAAQQIVLSIVGAVAPGLANAAAGAFGQSPLASLLSIFSSGAGGLSGGLGQTLAGLFSGGAAAGGAAIGAGGVLAGSGLGAGVGLGAAEGFGVLGGAATAGLAALGTFVPILGVAILAYSLWKGGAFHSPAQVQGTFGIRSATEPSSTFEDQASTTSTKLNLQFGFLDQGTQEFSGEAAQVFNKIVAGAVDAFATRFSPEQSAHFAEVLKNMTFDSISGTYTTEDFLQKAGGDILQKIVVAAFQDLDPALASVEKGFSGTADQVATFTNSLLGIYDATKNLPDQVKANIEGALTDSTQELADKVLAFAQIFATFGDAIPGVASSLQGLSGTDIPAFIDALGGAQSALQVFDYLNANFLTSQQRLANASADLDTQFTNLGLAVPQTHAQFLALLNSFDLTTEAGRKLYASVLGLAPEFIAIHGTADQAASSLNDAAAATQSLADAAHNLSGTALQSAQDFYSQHFLTPSEQDASRIAADQAKVNDEMTSFGDKIHQLGYDVIPTTTEGFRKLYDAAVAAYGADSDFVKSLLLLAPTIVDLGQAATTTANQIADAASTITNAGVSAGNIDSAASKFVSKFMTAIGNVASFGGTGDLGAKLGTEIGLIGPEIADLQAQYAAQLQLTGGIVDATATQLQEEIAMLTTKNDTFVKQLAQFTVLKAQYGADIAQQLVDLTTQYNAQAQALRSARFDTTDALAALNAAYQAKWTEIINGTASGVTGTLDQLAKLRQGILAYADSLLLGDLSPLSPTAKLQQAQQQYATNLTAAQGGDQTALQNYQNFANALLQAERAVYGSSSAYTDAFQTVQRDARQLGTAGFTDVAVPGTTTPGTPATPAVVVAPGSQEVATATHQKQTHELLKSVLKKLEEQGLADRAAQVAVGGEIVTAITDTSRRARKQADAQTVR